MLYRFAGFVERFVVFFDRRLDEVPLKYITPDVATPDNLPITGNRRGDIRRATSTNQLYVWTRKNPDGTLTGWEYMPHIDVGKLETDIDAKLGNLDPLESQTLALLKGEDGDGSSTFTDTAGLNTMSVVTGSGSGVVTETEAFKFGTGSVKISNPNNNNAVGKLQISADAGDENVFNPMAGNSKILTISSWVKFLDTDDEFKAIFGQYQLDPGGNTFWGLRNRHGQTKMTFFVKENNSTKHIVDSTSQYISDTNWHHVAICVVNGELGVYLDGTQIIYLGFSTNINFTEPFLIGSVDTVGYGSAYYDDILVRQDNFFNASPNSGKTDTITIPSAEATLDTPEDFVASIDGSTGSLERSSIKVSEVLKTKVVEIGDWNMDTTATLAVAHGLTASNIRSVEVIIRHDNGTDQYRLDAIDSGETVEGGVESIGSTNINLRRVASGLFDGTNFDSTSFNRGYVHIKHV